MDGAASARARVGPGGGRAAGPARARAPARRGVAAAPRAAAVRMGALGAARGREPRSGTARARPGRRPGIHRGRGVESGAAAPSSMRICLLDALPPLGGVGFGVRGLIEDSAVDGHVAAATSAGASIASSTSPSPSESSPGSCWTWRV
eukprot:scaffold2119_cov355-Prasinococcus_capsulatus_cf.AAC.4